MKKAFTIIEVIIIMVIIGIITATLAPKLAIEYPSLQPIADIGLEIRNEQIEQNIHVDCQKFRAKAITHIKKIEKDNIYWKARVKELEGRLVELAQDKQAKQDKITSNFGTGY